MMGMVFGFSGQKASAVTVGFPNAKSAAGAVQASYFYEKSIKEPVQKIMSAQEQTLRAVAVSIAPKIEYSPNTYPVGQCTWGAKELAPWIGNNWGNANDWAISALSLGFDIGTSAKVGAVMVWSDGGYGHVAIVTDVAADGMIQVQEANYAGNPAVGNYRGWFDPAVESAYAAISYIYAPTQIN